MEKTSMTVQLEQRLITVKEYHQMVEVGILTEDDPIELLDGKMIYMSPVGSKHSASVDKIFKLFNDYFGEKATIKSQNPITLVDHSEPEPDITVAKPRKDFYASAHPTPIDIFFIIEVSDTTLEKDREVKLPIYAKAGIPEYWVINLNEQQIEVYSQPFQNNFRLKRLYFQGDKIELEQFKTSVEVNELFI